jgi:sugar phosphate isomerase/epimerase
MGRMLETDPAGVLQGSIRPVDFPRIAKLDHGIDAVEYVSLFYPGTTGGDSPVIKQLRETADAEGVRSVLIMVDREGALGDPDTQARARAVSNHHKWVDAAAYLGCHSIRVNAESQGTWDEQRDRAADGLAKLSEYAAGQSINVIVENHGGLSSNGEWLSSVIRQVGMDNCGTLPDFGNFKVSETERYDTYLGVEQLMPFAKGVSAKSYDFDVEGNETTLDYRRLLAIVRDAGYTGYVGVEYEGSRLSEPDGIAATRNLLLTIGAEMDA